MSSIDGLRFPTLEVWNRYPHESDATRLAFIIDFLPGSEERRRVDGDNELTIRITESNPAVQHLTGRRVIELFAAGEGSGLGIRRHYRIASRSEADWLGPPAIDLKCLSPLVDLADLGLVSDLNNGVEETNLGAVELTIDGHFALLRAFWNRKGASHFIGTDSTATGIVHDEVVTVDVNGITSLEYLRAIESATGLELFVDSDYNPATINIGEIEIGFAERIPVESNPHPLPIRHLVVGETLDRLERKREIGRFATVIVPAGGTRDGALAPDGISQLVFRVSAVDSGNNRLTIEDPADTAFEPIRWDDQFGGSSDLDLANMYVVDPTDFTLHEIVDTLAASQEIEIGDVTNFGVGDLIELRASSADAYLTEIPAPQAYEDTGRRAYPFVQADLFPNTLRNYVSNPYAREWASTPKPYGVTGKANGSHTAVSTVNLDGLPANLTIPDGSILLKNAESGPWVVDGEQTTDGSGTIALALGGAFNSADNDGVVILLAQTSADGLPDGWEEGPEHTTGQRQMSVVAREPGHVGDLVGAIDGTISPYNKQAACPSWRVTIDGLTDGDTVQPGDFIESGSVLGVVLDRAVASGGSITLETYPLTGTSSVDLTNDDPVTIYRPDWDEYLPAGAEWILFLLSTDAFTSHPARGPRTPLVPVKAHASKTSLTFAATFLAYNTRTADITVTPTTSTVDGLRLRLLDDAGTELAIVEDPERTFPARTFQEITLQGTYELTASEHVRLEVGGIALDDWGGRADLLVMLTDLRIGYGDGTLPVGEFGGQQALFRLALDELEANDEVTSSYQGIIRDPAARTETIVASNQVRLGDTVQIHAPALAVNVTSRIVEMARDLTDPERLPVVFDVLPRKITRRLAELIG